MQVLSIEQTEEVQGGNPVVAVAAIAAGAAVAMTAIGAWVCSNGGSASFSWGGWGGSCNW